MTYAQPRSSCPITCPICDLNADGKLRPARKRRELVKRRDRYGLTGQMTCPDEHCDGSYAFWNPDGTMETDHPEKQDYLLRVDHQRRLA